jgi:hypothetical protein
MRKRKIILGNTLANKFPEITKDWDYEKNSNLTDFRKKSPAFRRGMNCGIIPCL